jgi:hypothetical protein
VARGLAPSTATRALATLRSILAFAVADARVQHNVAATILGAFLAGVIVRRTDESPASQEAFQDKLEAIGFGFLIPMAQANTLTAPAVLGLFCASSHEPFHADGGQSPWP